MEQFIGLIIMFVVWGIISSLRKSAKKQQTMVHKQTPQGAQSTAQHQPSTMAELNQLFEMLTGEKTQPVATPSNASIEGESIQIESITEEGGIEATPPVYSSFDQYTPSTSSLDDYSPEENLHTYLNEVPQSTVSYEQKNTATHPVLSGFDLKKAVVYSAILEPKYF